MTDEQYIDDLFAREGIGWDKTPGFRAFVLHLMGIIGERPRAGDVSSMHLAYTAGLEHGKEWTDERPTEPGEYWAALHPDQRDRLYASPPVMCATVAWNDWTGGGLSVRWFDSDRQECSLGLDDLMFDGAKWSRRETPADPFEVTG